MSAAAGPPPIHLHNACRFHRTTEPNPLCDSPHRWFKYGADGSLEWATFGDGTAYLYTQDAQGHERATATNRDALLREHNLL